MVETRSFIGRRQQVYVESDDIYRVLLRRIWCLLFCFVFLSASSFRFNEFLVQNSDKDVVIFEVARKYWCYFRFLS